MRGKRTSVTGWAMVAALCCGAAEAQVPGVTQVLVIGVDGLGPQGFEQAETPHMDALIAGGAHTFHARAVMPTSSSPNWASMIMGAGPEQHGVLSNEWPLPSAFLPPTATGIGNIFPTMFGVLREQRPDAVIAVIHHWMGFGRLFERRAVDVILPASSAEETRDKAVDILVNRKPTLTFVHFDHVDKALHGVGFLSEPYFRAVELADALIGDLLAALDRAGTRDTTLILLTSDHGGKEKNHGGSTLAEIEIPWIVSGSGVRAGHTIAAPVNTYDTAATVAHALGLAAPAAWIARVPREAFSE